MNVNLTAAVKNAKYAIILALIDSRLLTIFHGNGFWQF